MRARQSLALCACALTLAACSDILPGLNVSEGKSSHQYQVEPNQQGTGYEIVAAKPLPSYQIITVTPDVLVNLASHRSEDEDSLDTVPSLLPSTVPPEYRLGPGDVFFVVVWDHPELTAPYTGLTQDLTSQGRLIAADGTAFYPYVGSFKAAGMTASELRTYLASRLKAVVQNPQVDVRIVSYRAGRVEITGEVGRPGTLTFDDTPKGVLQAIDSSGGLAPGASRRRALLVRNGVIHRIDLAGLLSGTRLIPNPELKPGDVLHIPDQSGDQVFILGAVARQAPVVIQQDSMSLIQALTDAGGLDINRGKDAGVLVFRPHLSSDSQIESKIFTLDIGTPEGMLLASQFELEPHDVVYVKATAFAQYNSVVNELLPTVTGIYQATLISCYAHHGASC
jgi:polysaccharide biosynthesis/export protein